jgi:stage IV sporulation protein FB
MFGSVEPTAYDLRFSLFGIPVRVSPWFWLMGAILGYQSVHRGFEFLLAWMLSLFVSILVHEMGHALVYRFLGQRSAVVLHGFGGFTVPTGGGRRVLSKGRSIAVSLAGIVAQLLLLYLPARYLLNTDWAIEQGGTDWGVADGQLIYGPEAGNWDFNWVPVLFYAQFINLWWAVFNALPIRPLDGGHVAEELIGRENACKLSIGAAVVGAFLALTNQPMYLIIALLMAFFAFQNYRELKDGMSGGVFEVEAPDEPQRGGGSGGGRGRSSHPGDTGSAGRGRSKRGDRSAKRRRSSHLQPVPSLQPEPGPGASADVEAAIWNELRDGDKDRAASMLRQSGSTNGFLQGSVALAQGHPSIALDLLQTAYSRQPDGPPNRVLANLLAEAGQAVPLTEILVNDGETGVTAAASLQTHLHYANRFEEAARVGELVFAAGPSSPAQTAFEVACAWSRSGNSEEGLRWIEAAIDAGFKAPAILDKEPDLLEVRAHPGWDAVRSKL